MDYDSNLVRFLILAPVLPGAITLYVLFQRKFHREIPTFVAYLFLVVVGLLALFLVYQKGTDWNYFYTSEFYDCAAMVIAFLVIIDIFRKAMVDYEGIRKIGTLFLVSVGLALVVLAIGIGYFVPTNADRFVKTFLTMERSVRVVQVGLVVAIFGFSSFLGISWRHHLFGIVLGFGLYAAVNLALIAYVSHVGATVAFKVFLMDQVAYALMVFIWMSYVLPAKHRQFANIPSSSRAELERWNTTLSDLLHR